MFTFGSETKTTRKRINPLDNHFSMYSKSQTKIKKKLGRLKFWISENGLPNTFGLKTLFGNQDFDL